MSHWSECASVDTAATSREGRGTAASEDDEDDNLEECMFAFPDSKAVSAEEDNEEADISSLAFHIELVGLEDSETLADNDNGAPTLTVQGKYDGEDIKDQVEQPPMGASPVLLSALERVAAVAGNTKAGRLGWAS